jgi:hypothetical protein
MKTGYTSMNLLIEAIPAYSIENKQYAFTNENSL